MLEKSGEGERMRNWEWSAKGLEGVLRMERGELDGGGKEEN